MAVLAESHCGLEVARPADGSLRLVLSGNWRATDHIPDVDPIATALQSRSSVARLEFDASRLQAWDSGALTFILKIVTLAGKSDIAVDTSGLPAGLERLLQLATAVPERAGARRTARSVPLLDRVGNRAIWLKRQADEMISFVGDITLGMSRFLRHKSRYRRADFVMLLQECGVAALPIVSLISFLVGLILAFVGAVQLRQFGAQIYVADLVGIAMTREMGAVMTGIIMAGRTGAAFAAQIGTMQVNEEVDALKTFGFSPLDFLVTPRVLALVIMMPLLCIYADLMGIIGGGLIGITMLQIPLLAYVHETVGALSVMDFAIGIFKAGVFGVLIALAGCLRGMKCGRSALAVGSAATSAVVTAIVLIIVTDGLFAVLTEVLGI